MLHSDPLLVKYRGFRTRMAHLYYIACWSGTVDICYFPEVVRSRMVVVVLPPTLASRSFRLRCSIFNTITNKRRTRADRRIHTHTTEQTTASTASNCERTHTVFVCRQHYSSKDQHGSIHTCSVQNELHHRGHTWLPVRWPLSSETDGRRSVAQTGLHGQHEWLVLSPCTFNLLAPGQRTGQREHVPDHLQRDVSRRQPPGRAQPSVEPLQLRL